MMNISGPNINSNASTSDGKARWTLSINKGYWNLIPPLSEVEFNLLKQSIKEEGLHVPLIVN